VPKLEYTLCNNERYKKVDEREKIWNLLEKSKPERDEWFQKEFFSNLKKYPRWTKMLISS